MIIRKVYPRLPPLQRDLARTQQRLCLVVKVDLFLLTTTHEGGLGTLVVDVGPEFLQVGEGRLLGLFDGSLDFLLGSLVDGLHVSVSNRLLGLLGSRKVFRFAVPVMPSPEEQIDVPSS